MAASPETRNLHKRVAGGRLGGLGSSRSTCAGDWGSNNPQALKLSAAGHWNGHSPAAGWRARPCGLVVLGALSLRITQIWAGLDFQSVTAITVTPQVRSGRLAAAGPDGPIRNHPVNARNRPPTCWGCVAMRGELETFRRRKDHFFAGDAASPLTEERRLTFQGLHYFPENPYLAFDTIVDRQDERSVVRMKTTTGEEKVCRRYGSVRFVVDGMPAELTLYLAPGQYELFAPFRDATSGVDSYGAGRYLEVPYHGGHVRVDFNYAYNPYCAYNPTWSCLLPPAENWLKVPIHAGERTFEGHTSV